MSEPEYRIPDTVLSRQVNDEMVLLDLVHEQYYALDEIGSRIFTAVTEMPLHAALGSVSADYDVEGEVLATDANALLASLVTAGLLTPVEGDRRASQ